MKDKANTEKAKSLYRCPYCGREFTLDKITMEYHTVVFCPSCIFRDKKRMIFVKVRPRTRNILIAV